jgi:hypothetical protein
MECYTHCQSCGMPLDEPCLLGTEKNGGKSTLYCIYCYKDGAFTAPELTLEDMQDHIREELQHSGAAEEIIREALDRAPLLIRWQVTPSNRLHRRPLPVPITDCKSSTI